jgi:hypothetical protein
MRNKKSMADITMELLRVREHGRIYVDKNGMYPLYRIAEVLLSSKENLRFVRVSRSCEEVLLENEATVLKAV